MVNERVVLDKAKGTSTESTKTVTLTAGKPANITVEYVHETGRASIHLDWAFPNGKRQVLFPVSHP